MPLDLSPVDNDHVLAKNPAMRTSCYRLLELGQFRRYYRPIWNHVWDKMSTDHTVQARDHRLPDYYNNIGAANVRSFYEVLISIAGQHISSDRTDFYSTSGTIAHRVRKHHDLHPEEQITSTVARKQLVLEMGRWYLFTRNYEDYFPTAWRESWVALAERPWPRTSNVNSLSVMEALRLFSELPEDITVFHFSGEIEWHILEHYKTTPGFQAMLDSLMQRYSNRLLQDGHAALQHPLTSGLPLWIIIEDLMASPSHSDPIHERFHQGRLNYWQGHWTAVLRNNETA